MLAPKPSSEIPQPSDNPATFATIPAEDTSAVLNASTITCGDTNVVPAGSHASQDATSIPSTPTHPHCGTTITPGLDLNGDTGMPANIAADAAFDAATVKKAAATIQLNKLMAVGAKLFEAAQRKAEEEGFRTEVAEAEAARVSDAEAGRGANAEAAEVADAEAAAAPAGTSHAFSAFEACAKGIMRLTEAAEEPGLADASEYEDITPPCSSAADILRQVLAEFLTVVDAQEQLGNLAIAIQLLYPVSFVIYLPPTQASPTLSTPFALFTLPGPTNTPCSLGHMSQAPKVLLLLRFLLPGVVTITHLSQWTSKGTTSDE